MPSITRIANWILRQPLIWGALCGLVFYAMIRGGYAQNELIDRYFDSHWVSRVTTSLFFVGAASLVMRWLYLSSQWSWLDRPLFDAPPAGGQPPEEAGSLVARLDSAAEEESESMLVGRMRAALEHVRRKGSADDLDDHLWRLEEGDAEAASSAYALVRIVIWAIPILGFLGTVIGITIAIAELNPEQLENSLTSVTDGLGTAFDTTALALALSMPLMFGKFAVERYEERLLRGVSQRVDAELVGRFQQYGATTDPNVAAIRRMSEQVVRAVEVMAARQADLWKSTIDETHEQWSRVVEATGSSLTESIASGLKENLRDHARGLNAGVEQQLEKLNTNLADQNATLRSATEGHLSAMNEAVSSHLGTFGQAVEKHTDRLSTGAEEMLGGLRAGLERMGELLVEALHQHGTTLTDAERDLASENRRHLSEVEAALGEAMVVAADRQEKLIGRSESVLRDMERALVTSAEATVSQQEQLLKQGDVLLRIVESTRQVQQLEETLSKNLALLGKTHNFEETLLSLSAAIQLLSVRVGRSPVAPPESDSPARPGQAA